MDYEAHLKKHQARVEEQAKAEEEQAKARLKALEMSCEKAQEIIRGIIKPAFDKMNQAILAAGKESEVKIDGLLVKEVSNSYDHRIAVRSNRLTLIFDAYPENNSFRITFSGGTSTHLYKVITKMFVEEKCHEFMHTAFPA